MATEYILAPNDRYYVVTRCGVVAVNGRLITLDAATGLPKSTYRDPAGTITNPTVMDLGSDGSPGYPVYWKITDNAPLYKIIVEDASGNIIYEEPNYPIVGGTSGGSIINVSQNAVNYFRNEQFNFWHNGTTFDNTLLIVGTVQIADDWYFARTNTNASIQISQVTFAAGQSLYPFTPVYALQYQVLTPSADTQNDIEQRFESVQTLNNTQVTVGFYAATGATGTTAQIQLITIQNFGVGGSTTVETPIQTFTVTDSPQFFSTTFVVPSIAGQTIGTSGDYLSIVRRFNPNLIQIVQLTNNQFQYGVGTGINYPYITIEEQFAKDIQLQLISNNIGQGTDLIGVTGKPEYTNLTEFDNEIAPHNYLICADFPTNPRQFGETQDGGSTTVLDSDGNYILDGVILISDGDDVVSQSSTPGQPINLFVVQSNRKFGIFQIVEPQAAASIYNNYASAMVQMSNFRTDASPPSSTWKIAIVGYVGTEGTEPRQIVVPGGWNGSGTNPDLATGWSYLGVSDPFTVDYDDGYWPNLLTDTPMNGISNITIPSPESLANFDTVGVMVWLDDSNSYEVNDGIRFYRWNLTNTKHFTVCEPLSYEQSLAQAQRYFQKSYPPSAADAWKYSLAQNQSSLYTLINGPAINSQLTASSLPPVSAFSPPDLQMTPLYNFVVTMGLAGIPDLGHIIVNAVDQNIPIELKVNMYKPPAVSLYNSFNSNSNTAYCYYNFTAESISGGVTAGIFSAVFNTTSQSVQGVPLTDIPFNIQNVSTDIITLHLQYSTFVYFVVTGGPTFIGQAQVTITSNPVFAIEYIADALLGV